MDLINFLPDGSAFKRGSFKRWNDDENSTLLTLAIPHGVSAVWGRREVEGTSDINYVLQSFYKTPPVSDSLTIGVYPIIGHQTTDLLRGLIDALRPRMSHNVSETATGAFDLRALCYTVGAVVGSVATGGSLRLDAPCAVRLMPAGWTVPSAGEVTIAPGVARTPREFASLLALLGTSGTKVLQLMSDTVPAVSSRVLTGNDLGAFALRLAAVLLSSAQNVGCGDHHFLAFYRGMTHSVRLWGHSDEGGWIRGPLRRAAYPPSCGVVSIVVDTFIGISTRDSLSSGYVPKTFMALFLKFTGLLVISDPGRGTTPTVLKSIVGAAVKPSDVEGLEETFQQGIRKFRSRLCDAFDLHASGVMDTHSLSPYFHADKVDSHLSGEFIVPFWWVEPSALVTADVADYDIPAYLGGTKVLPLCKGATLYKSTFTPEVNGKVFGGCKVLIKESTPSVRMSGMSYVMSSAYCASNGLGQCEYVVRPDLGTFTTDASFIAEGSTLAPARRWVTPHNPMPSPVEGAASYPLTFEYTYRGEGKEPTLGDWVAGTVSSGLGLFRVVKNGGTCAPKTHRFVPPHLRTFINQFNNARNLSDLSILSEYVAKVPPPPAAVPPPPPEDPSAPDDPEPIKSVVLKNDDPSNEYAEEVNVRMDASAGARPDLPYTPPQDESPPGSDLSAPSERAE